MSKLPKWEKISLKETDAGTKSTMRLKIFGGWMVSNCIYNNSNDLHTESSIFVPDPNHEWSLE